MLNAVKHPRLLFDLQTGKLPNSRPSAQNSRFDCWRDCNNRRMNVFGPVYEAAHGGQSSPSFDLFVGFAVLAMTWFGVRKKRDQNPRVIWIAIAISILCAVFIFEGIRVLIK